MKEFKFELYGMSCGSCEKIVKKVAEENNATVIALEISDSSNKATLTIACEEEKLEAIKQQLAEKGFSDKKGGEARGDPNRVKQYILALIANEPHVEIEAKLASYALGSLAALIILCGLGYAYFLQGTANAPAYAPLLFLVIASSVLTMFSYHHMGCYKNFMSCTNGMMVGMTMGMISGFMIGALLGATNGMFVGSTVGLVFGVALGGNLGRYSGVMGAMEGIMAGLMAGIMGAMTSVMLIRDNLVVFLYILFAVCTFMLGGLSYMMYREAGAAPKKEFSIKFSDFFSASAFIILILVGIMFHGPKGILVYP